MVVKEGDKLQQGTQSNTITQRYSKHHLKTYLLKSKAQITGAKNKTEILKVHQKTVDTKEEAGHLLCL